jgi:hypothetical protein
MSSRLSYRTLSKPVRPTGNSGASLCAAVMPVRNQGIIQGYELNDIFILRHDSAQQSPQKIGSGYYAFLITPDQD